MSTTFSPEEIFPWLFIVSSLYSILLTIGYGLKFARILTGLSVVGGVLIVLAAIAIVGEPVTAREMLDYFLWAGIPFLVRDGYLVVAHILDIERGSQKEKLDSTYHGNKNKG